MHINYISLESSCEIVAMDIAAMDIITLTPWESARSVVAQILYKLSDLDAKHAQ